MYNMYSLRARTAGATEAQRRRAVSGRMITDVEMNGTVRGAVELFNLASRLRHGDALFAECLDFPDTGSGCSRVVAPSRR